VVRLEGRDRQAQRLAALLLLGLEVEVGAAVIDLAESWDGAGAMEELFAERRLAGTGVPGQDDAPKVGQVDTLHRHGAFDPPAEGAIDGARRQVWTRSGRPPGDPSEGVRPF
jgi:hypothetical protein